MRINGSNRNHFIDVEAIAEAVSKQNALCPAQNLQRVRDRL
jgi:hypothetical protein